MNILVVGGGAREHAIADALHDAKVFAFMPMVNPGIKNAVNGYNIGSVEDTEAIVEYAKKKKINIAVIGPEASLAAGAVDVLEEAGIGCVGPRKDLAQIETSKGFTRELLQKYKIKASPHFKIFGKLEGIDEYLKKLGQYVIKPDGLTGGKGVKVFGEHITNNDEALAYCEEVIKEHGLAVIEEKLDGEEFSLQTLTDGQWFLHFPPVQDHKRAYEDDTGPNTGGMGSYSGADFLLPFLKADDVEEAKKITEQVAAALKQEFGREYKGVLYGGFIKTKNGIKLVEYNARFGDPEAMNVLPLLKTSFAEICRDVVDGNLEKAELELYEKATVCKYVVPEGYPENPKEGVIYVPNCREHRVNALLYYAAVNEKEGQIHTTTSRAAAFVGMGDTIEQAEQIAEQAVNLVKGPVRHRKDIGTKKLIEKRIEHVRKLHA